MTKVVIEVRGGMVVAVYSHEPIEYAIVDWDNPNPEDIDVFVADETGPDIHELFSEQGEEGVAEALKRNGY